MSKYGGMARLFTGEKKKQVVSHSYTQYKSDVSLFNFPSQCSKTTILKKENHHYHHINVIKTPLHQ